MTAIFVSFFIIKVQKELQLPLKHLPLLAVATQHFFYLPALQMRLQHPTYLRRLNLKWEYFHNSTII